MTVSLTRVEGAHERRLDEIGASRRPGSRQRTDRRFAAVCVLGAVLSLALLAVLLAAIGVLGAPHLDADFLAAWPSRRPSDAGFRAAIGGSLWVCGVCAAIGLPLGVGTAILLEEFRPRTRLLRRLHGIVQLNIANLAGVPSIVYGIIGLSAFAQMWGVFGSVLDPAVVLFEGTWLQVTLPLGRSVLAGGLTLMLVVLPIVIIASQEALRAVPDSLRESALALGGTEWQAVQKVALPAALPGILTGAILAMSRAIGEAAPILVISGVVYITWTPAHLGDSFTVMPLAIYDWAQRPQEEFHRVAAAGIVVLLAVLLTFNAIAIALRQKFQRPLS